jgi:nicotinamidase-related amidase
MDRLDPRTSVLVVVDVQERLAAALPGSVATRVVANAGILLEAARLLGVSVLASEQYPKGLGPTVGPIAAKLRALGVAPVDKLTFDAFGEPRLAGHLAERAPRAVVLLGVEAHVCIFQTARGLARQGIDVRIVADAVGSRREENCALGLALSERAGAIAMPAEAVVFDWLGQAGTDEFRAVAQLMR